MKTTGKGKGFRHGYHGTPTYRAWRAMIQRCFDRNYAHFSDYGGRGITVCERWKHSFQNFIDDMGEKPEGTSLDRFPNNDGNYEPSNCRWATQKEQCSNKRNNVILSFGGESMTLTQWAERLGVRQNALFARKRRGWTDQQIIQTPIGR